MTNPLNRLRQDEPDNSLMNEFSLKALFMNFLSDNCVIFGIILAGLWSGVKGSEVIGSTCISRSFYLFSMYLSMSFSSLEIF